MLLYSNEHQKVWDLIVEEKAVVASRFSSYWTIGVHFMTQRYAFILFLSSVSESGRKMDRLNRLWKPWCKARLFLIGILTGIFAFSVYLGTLQLFMCERIGKEVTTDLGM